MLEILAAAAAFLGLSLLSGVRIVREYERAVVFRLGRARKKPLGPGFVLLLPWGIDRSIRVDQRTRVIDITKQDVITRDNISIGVDAVVYAEIASPQDAILRVEAYMPATCQLAATTLRSVLGRMDLDDILAKRSEINQEIREILDVRTEQWGVEITAVEIKEITLPQEMKRAMARQAEAERERRAKIIIAEGELQAAEKLTQAAAMIASQPAALQLRLYQTLVEVASERNNTIVVPLPIELLQKGDASAAASYTSLAGAALASHAASGQMAGGGQAQALGAGEKSADALDLLKHELERHER